MRFLSAPPSLVLETFCIFCYSGELSQTEDKGGISVLCIFEESYSISNLAQQGPAILVCCFQVPFSGWRPGVLFGSEEQQNNYILLLKLIINTLVLPLYRINPYIFLSPHINCKRISM